MKFSLLDIKGILQCGQVSTLKTLRCQFDEENTEKIQNLKIQLPQISIDEEYFNIAHPKKDRFVNCQLWEITTKHFEQFDWN